MCIQPLQSKGMHVTSVCYFVKYGFREPFIHLDAFKNLQFVNVFSPSIEELVEMKGLQYFGVCYVYIFTLHFCNCCVIVLVSGFKWTPYQHLKIKLLFQTSKSSYIFPFSVQMAKY